MLRHRNWWVPNDDSEECAVRIFTVRQLEKVLKMYAEIFSKTSGNFYQSTMHNFKKIFVFRFFLFLNVHLIKT